MPAYNFQATFAEAVANGDKRQAIRKKRKRPTVPGDTLYLFTGQRTKQCMSIGEFICATVLPVAIYSDRLVLDGQELGPEAALWIATEDGFDTLGDMLAFFEKHYGLPQVNKMELIRW